MFQDTESHPDPFFTEPHQYQDSAAVPPARGLEVDDLFGFRRPSFWKKNNPPPSHPMPAPAYLGVAVSRRRLAASGILISLFLSGLGTRAAALQITNANRYRTLAESNRVRVIPLAPERGKIVDREGRVLVDNAPSISLTVIPRELSAIDLHRVTQIIGGIPDDLGTLLQEAKGPEARTALPIKTNLSQDEIVKLSVLSVELPGIILRQDTHRNVPRESSGEAFGHLLGYVGSVTGDEYSKLRERGYRRTDQIGKVGAEAAFENLLRGVPGRRFVEVDAQSRTTSIVNHEKTVPGNTVVLTIDREAQQQLEEMLARHLRAQGRRRGAAVALDPQSGEILALVSLPGYDSNLFAAGISATEYRKLNEDPDRPLYPRAIAGAYPSGSTIKPFISAAALDDGIITPQTTILSTGGIWYGKRWFFPDWRSGGHGPTDVYKAIADSVNTFFYTIGGGTATFKGLGPERIAKALSSFGFGSTLGIEIPGEAAGLVPTPEWKQDTRKESWFIGDTYHLSIGQGDLLVTPLQLAAATAAIANGGTLYQPRLLRAVVASDGSRAESDPVVLKAGTASPSSLAVVREGMRRGATAGGSHLLGDQGISAAGKTGTAQWNSRERPHAWFTGFAPAKDPRIVITVLLEASGVGEPKAVPVAAEFLKWYLDRHP